MAVVLLVACNYQPTPAAVVADAPTMPDAFSPGTQCPVTYTLQLSGESSRYRMIEAGARFGEHSDDCNNDLVGATHLVAIDTLAEVDQLELAITAAGSITNNKAWIGGVQPRDQVQPIAGWLSVTGGPLLSAWDDNEPNDTGGNEDNGENHAGIERSRAGVVDFPTGDAQGAVCECDGKPIDPAAAAAIAANRTN